MKFNFENLDEKTRQLMLDEVELDTSSDKLYLSKRFNDNGKKLYRGFLIDAIKSGDEQSLAEAIKNNSCFNEKEERKTKSGVSLVKIPETAHETLAESEFNRFYIRAICVRAIADNQESKVYRAKQSTNPRRESAALIDKIVDPSSLLADLRENTGVDTVLGLPPGPNSGLTIRIVS